MNETAFRYHVGGAAKLGVQAQRPDRAPDLSVPSTPFGGDKLSLWWDGDNALIVERTGRVWTDDGESLSTIVSRFAKPGIRAKILARINESEKRPQMVRCDCGHSVEKILVMSASLGTACPDCYDRMS